MQYQLDNYGSVEEVIEHLPEIAPEGGPNHFFVSDKDGNFACIEFINGKPWLFKGLSMPIPLLCNSRYPYEMDLLRMYKGFGGTRNIDNPIGGTDSRFAMGHIY